MLYLKNNYFFLLVQFLLVDLRCHGDSASNKKGLPHTVAAAARDVLNLVGFHVFGYMYPSALLLRHTGLAVLVIPMRFCLSLVHWIVRDFLLFDYQ